VRLGTEVITCSSVLILTGKDILTLALAIRSLGSENRMLPPRLVQYDQWGRRVDKLETCEGWRDLKAVAQTEGLPAIFYERKYNEHSRTYGFAKILLMVGDSHEVRRALPPLYPCRRSSSPQVFCPLSMTDGTARVIELLGSVDMKKELLPRLTRYNTLHNTIPSLYRSSFLSLQSRSFLCIYVRAVDDRGMLSYNAPSPVNLHTQAPRWFRCLASRDQCYAHRKNWSLRAPICTQRFQMVLQCYRRRCCSCVS
jgi:hypothetical protein